MNKWPAAGGFILSRFYHTNSGQKLFFSLLLLEFFLLWLVILLHRLALGARNTQGCPCILGAEDILVTAWILALVDAVDAPLRRAGAEVIGGNDFGVEDARQNRSDTAAAAVHDERMS